MTALLDIGGRRIGAGCPCFVIAEAGVNHNGDLELAKRLVQIAADARADAVKFQTFTAGALATAEAPKARYQVENTGTAESQLQLLRRLELTREMHVALIECCRRAGILFLSTPFDEPSTDLLDELGVPAFKVASGEITNIFLLKHIARKRKPIILSSGMSFLGEVETALRVIAEEGNRDVAVLHCVSNYPADPADVNLRAMGTISAAFGVPVGYSDHTRGIEIPIAATALGATIIEKHFTTDRTLPGPDQVASLEPSELVVMIEAIRKVEAALGDGRKQPSPSEKDTADVARRSLVAARDIGPGEVIEENMIAIKRPGTGLPPALRQFVVGRVARVPLKEGQLIRFDMLQ
jgi:N,N'-diacetyllegionaminate synthase